MLIYYNYFNPNMKGRATSEKSIYYNARNNYDSYISRL